MCFPAWSVIDLLFSVPDNAPVTTLLYDKSLLLSIGVIGFTRAIGVDCAECSDSKKVTIGKLDDIGVCKSTCISLAFSVGYGFALPQITHVFPSLEILAGRVECVLSVAVCADSILPGKNVASILQSADTRHCA